MLSASRAVYAALAVVAGLTIASCRDRPVAGPKSVEVDVREGGRSARRAAQAWQLPYAGRVLQMANAPEGVRVAQARGVSTLKPSGMSSVGLDDPRRQAIMAISRRGTRVAVRLRDGLHLASAITLEVDRTALGGYHMNAAIPLDGPRPRILTSTLWDLSVPRDEWASLNPDASTVLLAAGLPVAIDAGQRRLIVGHDDGSLTVSAVADGRLLRTVPRRARGRFAGEIVAVELDMTGREVALDRAGWLTCGRASAHVLPLAPPMLAAAIAVVAGDAWVLRGGRAVKVRCGPRLRVLCSVTGPHGDLRSAALVVRGDRVLAAGLQLAKVVMLPRCG